MKFSLALILSVIIAVGVVTCGFTIYQATTERNRLNTDLELRIRRIAAELLQKDLLQYGRDPVTGTSYADSITDRYNLLGLAIYNDPDSIVAFNALTPLLADYSRDYITQAITADSAIGDFAEVHDQAVYQYIHPLSRNGIPNSALIIYADAGYIGNIVDRIWLRNFFRWFLQALVVSFVIIVIIRWVIFDPINKIVEWIRVARSGNIDQLKDQPPAGFLAPLHHEIVHIAKAMHEARAVAEEEARLRSNAEAIWTPERLRIEMENLLQNKKMLVVSNREPYMHIHSGKEIRCIVPASGMITAMEPILKACGGLWIAAGTGDADREAADEQGKIAVPPEEPRYTLRRLWLTKEEEDHFYYGFSNEGLWPLCHIAHTRPVFRKIDWHHYKKVNEDFANAVIEETRDEENPFILIQDYHFALLPELIKNEKPGARVAIFWHIPWPNPESFGICPWQREILKGMLGADLIGFHTQYHCNHFLETVNNSLESRVLWENFSIKMGGQTTRVKAFPISIDFTLRDYDHKTEKGDPVKLLDEHGIKAEYMGVGVDRIDYTKGIMERFLAVERFLEKHPEYQGKFTFVQIGAPSRTLLKSYSDLVSAAENEANRINWRFKSRDWKAILFLKRHHSHEEIAPFYSAAHLCMVTSLHDGMNLVAKEYVAARSHNDGALILSRFAGAANELQGAIIINPYDIERTSDAIKFCLEMSEEEQQQRMKQMRQTIVSNNVYHWAAGLIRTMSSI